MEFRINGLKLVVETGDDPAQSKSRTRRGEATGRFKQNQCSSRLPQYSAHSNTDRILHLEAGH